MTDAVRARPQILGRVGTSLAGGYAFTWGVITLGVTGLVAAGTAYEEAFTLLRLVGFLVFLGVFLWTFVEKRLAKVAAVLFGGGAAMTALAWGLQALLLKGV